MMHTHMLIMFAKGHHTSNSQVPVLHGTVRCLVLVVAASGPNMYMYCMKCRNPLAADR